MPAGGDDVDRVILRQLSAVYAVVDPPPADLDARTLFAIDLENLEAELAWSSVDDLAVAARSDEQARTITFDADSRTIMITIAEPAGGLVRVDGWLAPGEALRVELRSPGPAGSRTVTADEGGRFVFEGVPQGLAQLVVHAAPGSGGPGVVTPSLRL